MLKQLRDQGLPLRNLHTVFQAIVLSCLLYALPARGPLLNVELVHKIDGFLKRSFRYGVTSKLPVPLPHLLFILSLITATLYTATFQNLKQIVFRLFRTLLAGLWLRLPNSVTSHLFSNLYSDLKSTNALNINFFLLPIKLLPLLSLLICTA